MATNNYHRHYGGAGDDTTTSSTLHDWLENVHFFEEVVLPKAKSSSVLGEHDLLDMIGKCTFNSMVMGRFPSGSFPARPFNKYYKSNKTLPNVLTK